MQKQNLILLGVAVLVLMIGNYLLSIGPATGSTSLTIAPIVMAIAFFVLIPLAIMYRPKKTDKSGS